MLKYIKTDRRSFLKISIVALGTLIVSLFPELSFLNKGQAYYFTDCGPVSCPHGCFYYCCDINYIGTTQCQYMGGCQTEYPFKWMHEFWVSCRPGVGCNYNCISQNTGPWRLTCNTCQTVWYGCSQCPAC